jgi:hypothetical protein
MLADIILRTDMTPGMTLISYYQKDLNDYSLNPDNSKTKAKGWVLGRAIGRAAAV